MAEPAATSSAAFQPWVPASEAPAELTFRAVALGSILGIVFGAASVYLGLKVGLTTSASIPIAVMAITILKKLGNSTILENNVVQTTGSAGESVAAAVVFTIPALIFLGFPMKIPVTFLIALTGGVLGVLMMIPLRRYLIVKEHGALRFPEGTACAEILIAGEQGGTSARKIFFGIGLGARFKLSTKLLGLFKDNVGRAFSFYPGSRLECETSPELLAVGYIIGYETSVVMVAGGLLAALILGPMVVFFGSHLDRAARPGHDAHPRHGLRRPQGQVPAVHRGGGGRDGRRPRARARGSVDLGLAHRLREAASGRIRRAAAPSPGPNGTRRSRGSSAARSPSSPSSRSCPSSG